MSPTIYCAVDESDGARRALAHAAGLAADLDLSLGLVHVAPDGPYPSGERAAVERGRHAAWEAAQLMFADLRQDVGIGTETPGVVMHGPPAGALVDVSEEDDVELLVMGSRRQGALKSVMLGSVSSRVAAKAACPVMIVPPASSQEGVRARPGRGIVCGIGDPTGDADVLRLASDLAQRLAEPLRVVRADPSVSATALVGPAPPDSVFTPAALPAGEFARELVLQGYRGELSVSVMAPALALEAVGRAENARMIVVGSGHTRRLGGLGARSTSMRLAASADRPVLVLPRTAVAKQGALAGSRGDGRSRRLIA